MPGDAPSRRAPGTAARWRSVAALAALLAALPAASGAQRSAPHPLPDRPRPLAERLDRADVVAVVRVAAVETGRLRVRHETVLRGEPPPRFTVKRSPLSPPPLAEGDRALLLLRGARPPYVLVDEPSETIRLADDAQAERWVRAVRAIQEHRGEPGALVRHYRSWIDEGPETLRELGFWALLEQAAGHPESFDAIARERARAAVNPTLPVAARERSAVLAGRSAAATGALLSALAERPEGAEPEVVAVALGAGARRDRPELAATLRAALAHPEAAVRRAALRGLRGASAPLDDATAELVARAAHEDPSETVRRRAERVLAARPQPSSQADAQGASTAEAARE